jgi:hypothetical protein
MQRVVRDVGFPADPGGSQEHFRASIPMWPRLPHSVQTFLMEVSASDRLL